jgi:hypothetical protein
MVTSSPTPIGPTLLLRRSWARPESRPQSSSDFQLLLVPEEVSTLPEMSMDLLCVFTPTRATTVYTT